MMRRVPPLRGLFSPRRASGSALFNPAAYGTVLARLSFNDITTLYQTTDTSSPVTAAGQSIGRVNNTGTLGGYFSQGTAGARPTYNTFSGAINGAVFDGGDWLLSSLAAASWKPLHDGAANVLVLMDLIVDSDAAVSIIADNGNGTAANPGMVLYHTASGTDRLGGLTTNGSANLASVVSSDNAFTVGTRHVVAWRWNYGVSGDDFKIRVGGTQVGTAESTTTPSASNPNFTLAIGRYVNIAANHFTGKLHQLLIMTGVDDANIPALEAGIQFP